MFLSKINFSLQIYFLSGCFIPLAIKCVFKLFNGFCYTLNSCEVHRGLKKNLTQFFSGSKTIADIVLYKIDRDTNQVLN